MKSPPLTSPLLQEKLGRRLLCGPLPVTLLPWTCQCRRGTLRLRTPERASFRPASKAETTGCCVPIPRRSGCAPPHSESPSEGQRAQRDALLGTATLCRHLGLHGTLSLLPKDPGFITQKGSSPPPARCQVAWVGTPVPLKEESF